MVLFFKSNRLQKALQIVLHKSSMESTLLMDGLVLFIREKLKHSPFIESPFLVKQFCQFPVLQNDAVGLEIIHATIGMSVEQINPSFDVLTCCGRLVGSITAVGDSVIGK